MNSNSKPKVLFVGGYGRCGSTLLDLILGQIDGFSSVGELRYIWERSFLENQLCGCERKFKECEFWNNVIEESFGSLQRVNAKEIHSLKAYIDRKRNIPFLAFPILRTSKFQENLDAYSLILGKLYKSIQKVSGARVIIDSSKNPSHCFILNTISEIDLYVIHLVRDSRAVSYSWLRKKHRPEVHFKKEYMPVHSPLKSALEWEGLNYLVRLIRYSNCKYLLVRYEELVARPLDSIMRIAQFVENEKEGINLDFICKESILFGTNHTVSGNPIRFKRGKITLQIDNEWEERMGGYHKSLLTFLTWPLLLSYGYFSKKRTKSTGSY